MSESVKLFVLVAAFVGADADDRNAEETSVVTNSTDGAEMILIPSGEFLMGTTQDEVDEQFIDTQLPDEWKKYTLDEMPRHQESVNEFYIYRYEVTNEQYKAFIDATGHRSPPHWEGSDFPAGREKHPVIEVNWDDAQAYCKWAGTRLPTEAEWEYAARGAAPAEGEPSRVFPWGDSWDRTLSNNASNHADKEILSAETWKVWYEGDHDAAFPLTSPGGSFRDSVSPFGVHDMAGNAWEWCENFEIPYSSESEEESEKPTLRARRGGSWANVSMHIRSADRQGAPQEDLNLYTGFRCAKSP